jgi:hypothetical protein
MAWPPPRCDSFLETHLRQPEGWERWHTEEWERGLLSGSLLVVVWWTDHAARRHYRVVGPRDSLDGLPRLEDLRHLHA